MKHLGYCLIRLLVAILCWLIVFAIMLPIVPSWSSDGFRFFPWLLSIVLVIVLPLLVAVVALIWFPLPGEKEALAEAVDDSVDGQVITTAEEYAQFLSSHIIIASYDTKVVGVTFDNADGSSRQRNISRCRNGDEIALQYFEYDGDPAYAVLTRHGQIGNLSADQARIIDRNYDGCVVQGTINKITGGSSGYPFGCNIHLTFFKEKPVSAYATQSPSAAALKQVPASNLVQKPKRRNAPSDPPVSEQFIAEAQWHAAKDDPKEF